MNNIRKTIGYADYSWNVITGCNNLETGICKVNSCYARKMAQRLKGRFGYDKDNPFKPTFHKDKLREPLKLKKPSIIFVADMGDIFCAEAKEVGRTIEIIRKCPHHSFLFLTKKPQYYQFFPLPDNCWLGTTINYNNEIWRLHLLNQNHNNPLWISFEPLYEPLGIKVDLSGVKWVVVGGQTNPQYIDKKAILELDYVTNEIKIPLYCKGGAEGIVNRRELPV